MYSKASKLSIPANTQVLRAEYTLSTAEYKIKDPDRDMNKLGNLNDLNTACARVSDTVLDPDFYVSTTEQVFFFAHLELLFFFVCAPRTDELYVSTTDNKYSYT